MNKIIRQVLENQIKIMKIIIDSDISRFFKDDLELNEQIENTEKLLNSQDKELCCGMDAEDNKIEKEKKA